MGRGGIAARKALAEKIDKAQRYRLTGIRAGYQVAECLDKYGRWELGYRMGSIVRTTAETLFVHWWGDEDLTYYRQGDARYEVDRGRWRLQPPPQKTVFAALAGTLTGADNDASIMPSPPARRGKRNTEEEADMPKTTPPADQPVERETYTAKQVATRIGTDAKTLRKFFRSPKSTFEPVGQGGRYEFDKADLPAIQKAFDAWKAGKPVKSDAMRSKPDSTKEASKGPVGKDRPTKHRAGPVTITKAPVVPLDEEEDDDLTLEDLPDEEPTEEELDDLEDLDLELDDKDED